MQRIQKLKFMPEIFKLYCKDAELFGFQRFFLIHKEINITEFAKLAGVNTLLLKNYLEGFKNPSKERKKEVLEKITEWGKVFLETEF